MKKLDVRTNRATEFVVIHAEVEKIINEMGVKNGICLIFCPHTTAGITINENADPDVSRDIQMELNKAVPLRDPDYRHMEGNSAAHIKSSMMGCSAQVPIENGRLCLGTWQGIYFCEFDGPRQRKVWVQVIEQK